MLTVESRYIAVQLDPVKIGPGSEYQFVYQNGSTSMRLLAVRLTRRKPLNATQWEEFADMIWSQDANLDIDRVQIGNVLLPAYSRRHPILELAVQLQVFVKNYGDVELMTGVELIFLGSL